MLWVKAFHIIFVVTWFAGLFYLPRLFIYHQEARDKLIRDRLMIMERRLLVITHIGGILALVFGIWMILLFPSYLKQGWLHTKLLFVIGLVLYHLYLIKLKNEFAQGCFRHTNRWMRIFNEVPALLLITIVVLVVVKPF